MIIKSNPNKYEFKSISDAIAENDGYCVCKVEHAPKNKCMCKDFRDREKTGFCHCGLYYKVGNYPIVTLCGSTRFKEDFIRVAKLLTLKGYVVLTANVFGHDEGDPYDAKTKRLLDEIHKQKIEMSDMIYVINKDGYIGESTRAEIGWAYELGKEVKFMEENKG